MNFLCTNSNTQDLFGLTKISLADAISKMDVPVLGCDTETSGLDFLDDNLLMIQIYNGEDNFIIDAQTVDILPLKVVFENKKVIKIFHNAKFDYKFLLSNNIMCERVYDTMLAEKVIHCGKFGRKYSLKVLLNDYFGIEMSKEVRNTFINHKGDFTKAQVLYGLDDTVKLLEIREKQLVQADKMDLRKVVNLENNAVLVYADIEFNGIFLDKKAWEAAAVIVKENIIKLYDQLDHSISTKFPKYKNKQTSLFGGERIAIINWDSPSQVLKAFKVIDPKLESVGAPALKYLAYKNPLIKDYVEYKEKSKLYNAYGPDFYKYLYSDGKVHTSFDQILNTGRISSRKPNLQQIPADNTYRNAFIPEDPDWMFVTSDFSAQELCIIAYGSQDPVWLKVLRKGGDLHGTCAELIFKEKWTRLGATNEIRKATAEGKKLRTHVKVINFALAYGASYFSISKSLDISEQEAKDLIKMYYATFPKIKGFLDMLGKFGENKRYIRTAKPFKRIRHFDPETTDKSEVSKIVRASKNSFVQGTAADMCKLALVLLREIIKGDSRVKIVLTVHDEINCLTHKDFANEFSEILSGTMMKSAEMIIGEGLIKCDTTISTKWEK